MSEQSEVLGTAATWLVDRWMDEFSRVLESMTEEHPVMRWTPEDTGDLGDGALVVEQCFKDSPEPILWIGLPETVHQDLGGKVLAAAGVVASEAEENRATALEIVEQSIGGLVSALNERLSRNFVRSPAEQQQIFPTGHSVIRAVISFGETDLAPVFIAFSPLLISWMEAKPAAAAAPDRIARINEPEAVATPRNFDLLLDVALPVSVSFGKTELAVKDVLKLTTGSIVELNRSVSEPVDIIVNNCTIARGEVVVVEGNYGVRILKLVSRKERLRTGGAAVEESRSRAGVA